MDMLKNKWIQTLIACRVPYSLFEGYVDIFSHLYPYEPSNKAFAHCYGSVANVVTENGVKLFMIALQENLFISVSKRLLSQSSEIKHLRNECLVHNYVKSKEKSNDSQDISK